MSDLMPLPFSLCLPRKFYCDVCTGEGAPLECAIMGAKTEKDILEAREDEVLGATVKRIPLEHFAHSKIEGTQDRFKGWKS